jgi:hypothetical protein
LWIPETGLMTKMHACFKHQTHRYVRHRYSPVRVKPPYTPCKNYLGQIKWLK